MRKSFNEIYEKIYKLSKTELEKIKELNTNEIIILSLFSGIIILITAIRNHKSLLIFFLILIISLIIFICIKQKSYRKLYKKKVINILVSEYDNSFEYIDQKGLSEVEYKNSGFDRKYDIFLSEDLIVGKLNDGSKIFMSEIVTQEKKTYIDSDRDRHTEYEKTFQGLYGYVELKIHIHNKIKISKKRNLRRNYINRIENENNEFEKNFDLIATDKIHAQQIFSSDLINKFLKSEQEIKEELEIKLEGDKLYFRCNCGQVFEPPIISAGVDFNFLLKYFNIIDYPIEIIEHIIANAKEL